MATNIKKEEAANAPKARAASLQTDLNRLENVKVCPEVPQPLNVASAAKPSCEELGVSCASPHVLLWVWHSISKTASCALAGAGVPAFHPAGQGDGGG